MTRPRLGRPSGIRGGFIWFQTPVFACELVPLMYARGLSMQQTVDRLGGRYNPTTVKTLWRAEHRHNNGRVRWNRLAARSAPIEVRA